MKKGFLPKINWEDCGYLALFAVVVAAFILWFSYVTGSTVSKVVLDFASIFFLGLVLPSFAALGFMIGKSGFESDKRFKRFLGVAAMGASEAIGLWSLSQVVPNLDPADCPAGPRYC